MPERQPAWPTAQENPNLAEGQQGTLGGIRGGDRMV
jgi:hypothetical protein